MNTRRGLGKGLGTGYKNLVPLDTHIHSLSAKGVKTTTVIPMNVKGVYVDTKDSNRYPYRTKRYILLNKYYGKVGADNLELYDVKLGKKIDNLKLEDWETGKKLNAKKSKEDVDAWLEWDDGDQNFKVVDDDGNELDRWYPDDVVDNFVEKQDYKDKVEDTEWEDGEYVLYDKDGNEIDRIYAEELVKEMYDKSRKKGMKYGYRLNASGWKFTKETNFGRTDETWKRGEDMLNLHKAHKGWMVSVYRGNDVTDLFFDKEEDARTFATVVKGDLKNFWKNVNVGQPLYAKGIAKAEIFYTKGTFHPSGKPELNKVYGEVEFGNEDVVKIPKTVFKKHWKKMSNDKTMIKGDVLPEELERLFSKYNDDGYAKDVPYSKGKNPLATTKGQNKVRKTKTHHTSMHVGDMVKVDDDYYVVAPMGFKKVEVV